MDAEIAGYFACKQFTTDWTTRHFPLWMSLLAPRRAEPLRILEIGSWEGRSALFFLNFVPASTIVCVDTFGGNRPIRRRRGWRTRFVLRRVERLFDRNLAQFSARLEKRKQNSIDALGELALASRCFDLIYVDGSHDAIDCYRDGALSWMLLAPGGIMIFDDYAWTVSPLEIERPKLGIDRLLEALSGQYRELHRDYQIALQKL